MSGTKDDAILDFIFDPTADRPLFPSAHVAKPQLMIVEKIPTAASLSLTEEALEEIKKMNIEGIRWAEQGKHGEAVEVFTQAIAKGPGYPSSYNNRAMVWQLVKEVDKALEDLQLAIKLADGIDTVTLKQAYSQRGAIRLLQDREEEARLDFEVAASLGSEFAKKEAVRLNPYAKLCSAMVTQMLKAETEGGQKSIEEKK